MEGSTRLAQFLRWTKKKSIQVGGVVGGWASQYRNTVDGRNPAPVDMINIPLFIGFSYIPGGAGFQPSTVLLKLNHLQQVFLVKKSNIWKERRHPDFASRNKAFRKLVVGPGAEIPFGKFLETFFLELEEEKNSPVFPSILMFKQRSTIKSLPLVLSPCSLQPLHPFIYKGHHLKTNPKRLH